MGFMWLIIGLCVGSFLNGVVYRATAEKNLFSARSVCSGCERKIAWYDLIPVISWFALKGKCRNCDRKIPFKYAVVELFVGLGTFYLFKDGQISLFLIVQYFFLLSFFLNVLTDAINFSVYDPFLYFMVTCGLLLALLKGNFVNALLSGLLVVMLIATASYAVQLIIKKQSMGSGDYFAFFVIGLTLPSSQILDLMLFSSLFGIAVSVVMKKKALPFFPLLFFGYLFVLVGGHLV